MSLVNWLACWSADGRIPGIRSMQSDTTLLWGPQAFFHYPPHVSCVSCSQARLQAPLRIELAPNDEEQYDDLDEIVARWVLAQCRFL